MIAVADLVKDEHLLGNYYSPDAYIQGDFEIGLVENRHGSRLIAMPQTLLRGIFAGLDREVGQATGVVLYNCGRWWGKNFYRRFLEEISSYYGKPLLEMETVEFLQCLKQCWKTHGWGTIEFDFSYYQKGFIVITTFNSAFAEAAGSNSSPSCSAEAGILSSFFSQMTGKNLQCVQTACESLGAEQNYFILGLSDRLKSAETAADKGLGHAEIMKCLVDA
jgi:uncharacterized protein